MKAETAAPKQRRGAKHKHTLILFLDLEDSDRRVCLDNDGATVANFPSAINGLLDIFFSRMKKNGWRKLELPTAVDESAIANRGSIGFLGTEDRNLVKAIVKYLTDRRAYEAKVCALVELEGDIFRVREEIANLERKKKELQERVESLQAAALVAAQKASLVSAALYAFSDQEPQSLRDFESQSRPRRRPSALVAAK